MFSETNWLGKLFQFGTVFIAMELLMTSSSCPRNYSWHRRHVNTSYSWHRRLFSWRRRLIPIFYRATVYYIGIVSLKCVAVRICYCWGYIHVQYQTWTVLTAPTIRLWNSEARTLNPPFCDDVMMTSSSHFPLCTCGCSISAREMRVPMLGEFIIRDSSGL